MKGRSLFIIIFKLISVLPLLASSLPSPIPDKDGGGGDDDKQRGGGGLDGILSKEASLLNASTPLGAALGVFLGDHGTVIFQNGLVRAMGKAVTGNGPATAGTAACPDMSVIFARGTFEPGNVGILTGPPFFAALAEYITANMTTNTGASAITIQGVDYPADVAGFFAGGSRTGATKMAILVNQTLFLCPTTHLTISGYSQGAQVVHLAASMLPNNTMSKVASVVLFGDPKNGTGVSGVEDAKVLTVCHAGDDICKGSDVVGSAHLNYSADAGRAAMFALGGVAMLGITSASMKTVTRGLGS